MVIEIVDEPGRITAFIAELNGLIGEGLVTVEKVEVILYRHGDQV